jgi:hypothetical protein
MKTVVTKLDVIEQEEGFEKVVKAVHLEFRKEGQKVYKKVELPEPHLEFTEFEDLTEEEVIGWCMDLLSEIDRINEALDRRISKKEYINPALP